ncbi:MAG: hypothetical protein WAV04_02290 [Candidatus Microsaccharimonas sp.]|jgi:dipeptide/tripeptide permease
MWIIGLLGVIMALGATIAALCQNWVARRRGDYTRDDLAFRTAVAIGIFGPVVAVLNLASMTMSDQLVFVLGAVLSAVLVLTLWRLFVGELKRSRQIDHHPNPSGS